MPSLPHLGYTPVGMYTRACSQGHVGNSHRGRLRTEEGPNGSSYTTKPLAFIRWISCGRTDANCTPRTCVNSAIDARTRRRNSAIMSSCVGSDMGMVSLEAAWTSTMRHRCAHYTRLLEARGKIRVRGRGTREDTSPARGEDLLPFKYATFYTHDAHDKSPSVFALSGRE